MYENKSKCSECGLQKDVGESLFYQGSSRFKFSVLQYLVSQGQYKYSTVVLEIFRSNYAALK
jgi:hypothetical protein